MSCSLIEKLTDGHVDTVAETILRNINSPVDLVNRVCTHLILSGGKRVRPRLMLLCAGLLDGPGVLNNEDVLTMASAIEIIHTSTLMHDDVIDESTARRGLPSTNTAFSNSLAVLGGDYLFTKAFCLAHQLSSVEHRVKISTLLTDAISTIVQGEIEQMQNISDTQVSEETYFRTIYAKTSVLFEISAKIIAVILDRNQEQLQHLANFGRAVGNAFQIADDIMDYTSSAQKMGKNIGDDLNEEKMTLPLIYLLNSSLGAKQKEKLIQAIKNHDIETVTTALKNSDAISRCRAKAFSEASIACAELDSFPDSEYKQALCELAQKAANRNA